MVGIYKITNPKGKIYIGQSINIENRFGKYKIMDRSCIGPKLFNSLAKYGYQNHTFEVIEECNLEELDNKEFIHKQKILEVVTWGDVLFLQLKDKKGGKRSPQTKEKIRISSIGKNSKEIFQFDLDGNFIKKWSSITEAEQIYGTGIKSNLTKKTLTAGGYIWSYNKELVYLSNKVKNKWSSKNKPVLQLDLEGNLIKEWGKILDIETELNFKNPNITACCKGKQKTAYGFKWEYRD